MKLRMVAAGVLFALTVGSCQQVDKVVKGQQQGPGWQMTGQSRTEMTSDIQYLGASADGLIILRLPNGQAQVWKAAP